MKSPTKIWKLDSPKMCRDFLKQVRFGKDGSRIEWLKTVTGDQISIDEASDEQILQVANDIAQAIGQKK